MEKIGLKHEKPRIFKWKADWWLFLPSIATRCDSFEEAIKYLYIWLEQNYVWRRD